MKVKIINDSINNLPQYATKGSVGLDLCADIIEAITIHPQERKLIPTGLHIELPEGYEAQIRARSGLALKHGITVLNGVGTIDSDYNGEIGVILYNTSDTSYTINSGERIAQMVINKVEIIQWELTNKLEDTERGEGGFGHTGK
jgi:dUTP pyrophosphatase